MIAVDTNVLVLRPPGRDRTARGSGRRLTELAEGRGLWGLPVFRAGVSCLRGSMSSLGTLKGRRRIGRPRREPGDSAPPSWTR